MDVQFELPTALNEGHEFLLQSPQRATKSRRKSSSSTRRSPGPNSQLGEPMLWDAMRASQDSATRESDLSVSRQGANDIEQSIGALATTSDLSNVPDSAAVNASSIDHDSAVSGASSMALGQTYPVPYIHQVAASQLKSADAALYQNSHEPRLEEEVDTRCDGEQYVAPEPPERTTYVTADPVNDTRSVEIPCELLELVAYRSESNPDHTDNTAVVQPVEDSRSATVEMVPEGPANSATELSSFAASMPALSERPFTPAASLSVVQPRADVCASDSPCSGSPKPQKRAKRRSSGSKRGERHENKDPMETLSHDLSPEVYWILVGCYGISEQQALLDAQPGPYYSMIGTMTIVNALIDKRSESDAQTAALMAAIDKASVKQQRALRQCLRTLVKRVRKELYEKWFLDFARKADSYSHMSIGYAVYSPSGALCRQHAAGATHWRSGEGGGRQLVDRNENIVQRGDPVPDVDGKANE